MARKVKSSHIQKTSSASRQPTKASWTQHSTNPIISNNAYNFANEAGVRTLLDHIYNTNPDFEIFAGKELMNHMENFRKFGSIAGLKSPSIYYPFGGFDSHTAFGLIPECTDVYSFGKDSFGDFNRIFLAFANSTEAKGGIAKKSYDRVYDLGVYDSPELNQCLGFIAISRIIRLTNSYVTGIYYFNVNPDGSLKYESSGDPKGLILLDDKNEKKNAVIEFTDKDGNSKRFWYFCRDLNESNTGYRNFIDNLTFESSIIKGAYYIYHKDGYITRDNLMQETLAPIKRNNAAIVSDGVQPADEPYAIWQVMPNSYVLSAGEYFGYKKEGQKIYYGSGAQLIDENTPREHIIGYTESYDAEDLTSILSLISSAITKPRNS